jgi:tetratricopeptide (TPR) repeat protein
MTRTALITVGILCLAIGASSEEPQTLTEARKAILEEIPQVAVQKLRSYLQSPQLGTEERDRAGQLLAEALNASGKPGEALQVTDQLTFRDSAIQLTRARALMAMGRFADALEAFRATDESQGGGLVVPLGQAECLAALGQVSDAVRVLEPVVKTPLATAPVLLRLGALNLQAGQVKGARELIDRAEPVSKEDREWKRYLVGRLHLAEGQPLPTMEVFEELLREREQLTDQLVFGASLGLADARISISGYEKGQIVIEDFIRRHPTSRFLKQAFQKLDLIYSQQDDPLEMELHKWSQRQPAERAALALFYVGRLTLREAKYDKAEVLLHRFTQTFPMHPLLCEVHLMQADMHLALGRVTEAVADLEAAMRQAKGADQRGEIELRTAIAQYQQGEYLLAANLFKSAAQRSPRLRTVATYDAALAWLNQKNAQRFTEEIRALGALPNTEALRSDLLLEQALAEARNGEIAAEETLQLFVHQNPRHPRAGEARVALAELAFRAAQASANPNQKFQASQQAADYLQVANTEPHTPQTAAQADFLAVFLADAESPRDDRKVLTLGEEFLRKHRGSPLIPELRMKLGEVYFRTQDFANAETQFVNLATEASTSPYSETALFLAGQSAMKLAMNPQAMDRALGYFDQVVKREGPLRYYARQEQAIAQSRLKHEAEAIAIYDLILTATPSPDPELRFAALCGKGDNLVAIGRKESSKLEQAVAVYEQLAAAPNVTPAWRNQALYKKARTLALKEVGRTSEALTTYYDVLERSSAGDREHFWSAKAGDEAGQILESQEEWKAAIAIYNKVAALNGPRAGEFQRRAKQIRLDRFVWE